VSSIFKVDFDSMAWQDGRQGVRHKVYCEGSRRIFILPGSANAHRGLAITPGTRLILVEDI
jgi:hypothetical protein